MFIVICYLAILAVAAALTFAAFGDVSRTTPSAEGSRALFHAGTETPAPQRVTKKLFGVDSVLVRAAHIPPQQQRMLSFLEDHCPALPVRASGVTVLSHPSKFYEALKQQIRQAQSSVLFSALYIGDGPLSKSFVGALEDKVHEVVTRHEQRLVSSGASAEESREPVKPFEIGILLDYNRMHDRKNLVTVRKLLTMSHAMEYKYNCAWHGERLAAGASCSAADGTDGDRSDESYLNQSPVKVRLYLYQGPCRWNRLFAPLGRAKEVLGVQHTKIFVFDAQHVILTGANLSDDYFATRMDRYVVYENNAHVAYFYLELLKVLFAVAHPVVSFAEFVQNLGGSAEDLALEPRSPLLKLARLMKQRRRARADGSTGSSDSNSHHPHGSDVEGGAEGEAEPNGRGAAGQGPAAAALSPSFSSPDLSRRLAEQMEFPFHAAPSSDEQGSGGGGHPHGSPTLHKASDLVILPNALGFDPSLETEAYEAHTRELCLRFAKAMGKYYENVAYDLLTGNASLLSGSAAHEEEDGGFDSILFPTFQFGRVGIFHDSVVVKGLLSLASHRDHVYLTSPYLNVYSDFLDVFIGKAKADSDAIKAAYPVKTKSASQTPSSSASPPQDCADDNDFFFDVITASVKTNGWNGQRGFAGYIPFFYLQLERAFYFLVKSYGCVARVRVHEFTEKGLTFHAKGIYFSEHHPTNVNSAASASPASSPTSSALHSAPYLVAYGSTNYGYRSVHKDVEAEGFFFTFRQSVREQTRLELSHLLKQSSIVEERQFMGNEMGRFQPVVSLVAQMGQDFL